MPRKPVFQGLLDKREGEELSKTEVKSRCRDECESALGSGAGFLFQNDAKSRVGVRPPLAEVRWRFGVNVIRCRVLVAKVPARHSRLPFQTSENGSPMIVVNHTAKRTRKAQFCKCRCLHAILRRHRPVPPCHALQALALHTREPVTRRHGQGSEEENRLRASRSKENLLE